MLNLREEEKFLENSHKSIIFYNMRSTPAAATAIAEKKLIRKRISQMLSWPTTKE